MVSPSKNGGPTTRETNVGYRDDVVREMRRAARAVIVVRLPSYDDWVQPYKTYRYRATPFTANNVAKVQ